ncbi:hypothetical protein [Fodinibius sediminis]|uniref:hypothetical protein n=1 Tax=Fodinibius sediminis TaxID=1214077 RepID=UPI00163D4182|nr:hypothetical protein [Fodinibius sediminis]
MDGDICGPDLNGLTKGMAFRADPKADLPFHSVALCMDYVQNQHNDQQGAGCIPAPAPVLTGL